MSEALGNPEHPRRTRGTPGSVAWVHGFPDASGYKKRERKRKVEQSEMETIKARLAKLEEFATADQPSQWLEATPEATPPSQRRSNVASMELAQPDLTAPRYPVDTITEADNPQV